jgi:trimethylamine--corrinoid protein Co-methyltransferase
LDFVANMGSVAPHEVPSELSDRHNFARMIKNSTKPILFTAWGLAGIRDIHEMALSVRDGDEDTFRNTPFIIQYAEPVSPLCHPATSLQKLMFCAEKGIPVTYASGATLGGTAPATVGGALVLTNAEFLSGLVIAQLTRKGAPIIYGGCSSPLDMNTMACAYAGPDALHNYHMARELSAYYGLPDFNFGGYSDSKALDMQAAAEVALSIFQTGLAGSSLIHAVGYLEAGMTASLELIVFANEIISQTRHFRNMPPMDVESLAVEAICQVGADGNFIDHEHTFRHFK